MERLVAAAKRAAENLTYRQHGAEMGSDSYVMRPRRSHMPNHG